jgi:hypothetical protein
MKSRQLRFCGSTHKSAVHGCFDLPSHLHCARHNGLPRLLNVMSVSYTPHFLDRSNGKSLSSNASKSFHQSGHNAWTVASQPVHPLLQDLFAYYKAFLHTNAPSSGSMTGLEQDNDAYTCHQGDTGSQGLHSVTSSQPDARARAIPHHLAVRFANRPNNVAPLATIIEQGSYSTLNSRGSLLSVGRFPSVRGPENISPVRASHRISRSLEGNVLHGIQEAAPQKQHAPAGVEAHAHPHEGRSSSICNIAKPMTSSIAELPRFPRSQIGDADHDVDGRRSKGFVRGVLQNVRAASKSRSRSSSLTHAAVVETREDRAGASGDNSPLSPMREHDSHNCDNSSENYELSDLAQRLPSSAASTPAVGSQARNRKIPLTNRQSSAQTSSSPSTHDSSLPLFEQASSLASVSRLLPSAAISCSPERTSSVRLVSPEPRDVAYGNVTIRAPTLSTQHTDDTSAQHTFHGAYVSKCSTSSLAQHDRTRETSHNASFCSTLSTSYSGTVLGVDLDLIHETPRSLHQSSSPLPV